MTSNSARTRAGAATAVAQVLVMAGSSLLGLLVARELGSTGATDGFFAANAVYAIALFVAQSLRITAPATLLDPRPGTFARHVRAVGRLALALILLFAIVAAAADLLVPAAAVDTLRLALAVLAPAAVVQLASGLLAARCAVLGDFARPAGAYAGGALLTAVVFAALVGTLDVDAVAVAVAAGAVASFAVMAVVWRAAERRAGQRPAMDDLATVVDPYPGRLVWHFVRGAIPVLAGQALLTASVFSAGHIASGDGTLYSYGALAVSVLVAIIASPVSIVLAPEIARSWDRRPATLVVPTLGSYRLGALLLPALALPALLWGPWVANTLLTALTASDIEATFTVAAILAIQVLGTLLSMVPLVASVAGGLLGRVGAWSVAVVAVHLIAAPLVATTGSLAVLAVEGTLAGLALASVPIAVALRSHAPELLRGAVAVSMRYVLPSCATALVVWLALGANAEFVVTSVALAAGLAVQGVTALTFGRLDLQAVVSAIGSRAS